jgi:hypothetical protein
MPCKDGLDEYYKQQELDEIRLQTSVVRERNNSLEAMLCATLHTLYHRFGGVASGDIAFLNHLEVIEENHKLAGSCSLKTFWQEHRRVDIKRLTDMVNSLSSAERDMVYKILKDTPQ